MKSKDKSYQEPEIPANICPKRGGKANPCEINPGVWGYYCPRCGNKWLMLPDCEIEEINEIEDQAP